MLGTSGFGPRLIGATYLACTCMLLPAIMSRLPWPPDGTNPLLLGRLPIMDRFGCVGGKPYDPLVDAIT